MKVYLDTSAYAKRFIEETGSDMIENILTDATEIGLSIICIPELLSALNRRRREKSISKSQYSDIKVRLAEEIADANIIQLTDAVIESTTILLEKNILRAMDAIHIACAKEWQADIFLTSDKRQIKAAKKVLADVKLL
jgi:predicted nucleic acid-binding protein